MTTGQHDLAINDYSKAITINPAMYTYYNKRGIAFRRLGKYDEALDDFTKAIALDPAYAWSYDNRAWTYYHKAEYQSALDDFNKAIALDATLEDAIRGRDATRKVILQMQ